MESIKKRIKDHEGFRDTAYNDSLGIPTIGWGHMILPKDNIQIGIKALATNPRKSVKKGEGMKNIVVGFADCIIVPGHFIYADQDGVLLSEVAIG